MSHDGRELQLQWQHNRLIKVSLHSPQHQKTQIMVAYDYDDQGRLVAARDAYDQPHRFYYEEYRLIQHTSRAGLSFFYQYQCFADGWKAVSTYGDKNLYRYQFQYFPEINEIRITNSLDQVSLVKCNSQGLPILEIDPLWRLHRFEYDEAGRTTAVIDPAGQRTESTFDERGLLLSMTQADGTCTQFTYDDQGNLLQRSDPNQAQWSQQWNDKGLLLAHSNPLGGNEAYQYDALGRLTQHQDALGHKSRYQYNAQGYLQHWQHESGQQYAWQYDWMGRVSGQQLPNGTYIQYEYDYKSRLIRQTIKPVTSKPISSTATSTSSAFDQHFQQALPGKSTQITLAYDALDQVIALTDELGRQTRYTYTGLGTLQKIQHPNGQTTEYAYDTEEQLLAVRNAKGQVYRLQRDAIGRVIAETDYWGQTTRYRYNLAGHLQARLDPLGQVMQITTDVMGRVTQKQYPHPNYPDQLFTEHYEYGVLGELVACHNAHSRVERAYDVTGNLIKEQQQGLTVEYGYNVVGQQIQRKSTLGAEIGYQTDGLGRCTGLQLDQQAWIKRQFNALGLVEQEQTYAISSGATPISTSSPNDAQPTSQSPEQHHQLHHQLLHHKQLAYNGIGQLIQQHLSSVSAEQQPLNTPTQEQSQQHQSNHRSGFELNYLYGLDGQSIAWQDSQQGLTQVRHDPVGQIIGYRQAGQQATESHYQYDATEGLLPTHIHTHPSTQASTYQPRPLAHLAPTPLAGWQRSGQHQDQAYLFDRAGLLRQRQRGDNQHTFEWDGLHQLTKVVNKDGETEYGYDPLGRRVFKQTAGRRTEFYWEDDVLLAEQHFEINPYFQQQVSQAASTDKPKKGKKKRAVEIQPWQLQSQREYVFYPNTFQPAGWLEYVVEQLDQASDSAKSTNSMTSYRVYQLHTLPNGAPHRVTDDRGKVVWYADYSVKGLATISADSTVVQPLRLQGQYWDEESELASHRYRYFDPHIARFISQDPLGLDAGEDLYAYAPNVLDWADPLGLSKCTVTKRADDTVRLSQKDKFGNVISRNPRSIQDQMTLDAAKRGEGIVKLPSLSDSKFKGMKKMELETISTGGKKSNVHYVLDPATGKKMDFKFKKHSTDYIHRYEKN